MCLSVTSQHPDVLLGKGEHEGFKWEVVHNGLGYRCGYIRVSSDHPWFERNYSEIEAVVHGELTFSEADIDCGNPLDNGWWVGFDCAHVGDAPDPALPCSHRFFYFLDGIVRSQEYVESECKRLCEQAKAALVVAVIGGEWDLTKPVLVMQKILACHTLSGQFQKIQTDRPIQKF